MSLADVIHILPADDADTRQPDAGAIIHMRQRQLRISTDLRGKFARIDATLDAAHASARAVFAVAIDRIWSDIHCYTAGLSMVEVSRAVVDGEFSDPARIAWRGIAVAWEHYQTAEGIYTAACNMAAAEAMLAKARVQKAIDALDYTPAGAR